jgi:hypothetical protein
MLFVCCVDFSIVDAGGRDDSDGDEEDLDNNVTVLVRFRLGKSLLMLNSTLGQSFVECPRPLHLRQDAFAESSLPSSSSCS